MEGMSGVLIPCGVLILIVAIMAVVTAYGY
jgi:hypothetical protein